MSANKYLSILNGIHALYTAIVSSAGAADAGKLAATNAQGKWDVSLMPDGLIPPTVSVVASEAIAAGDFVNLHLVTGALRVRKANSTAGIPAHGFVLSSIASGATGTVYLEGQNTALSGLVGGSLYFLSGTAGGATTAVPTATNAIIQELGIAVSATALAFVRQHVVTIL